MARGSRIGYKRKTRNKVTLDNKGSDESDEDYEVSEDEVFNESEDEYCSLAEDESEASLGEFEDDDWVGKKVKKVGRRTEKKVSRGRKRSVVVKPKMKIVDDSEEEEDDDDYDYEGVDYTTGKQRKKNKVSHKQEEDVDRLKTDGFDYERPRKKSRISSPDIYPNNYDEKPRMKNKVSYREEKEDEDCDDNDDDDDEEFTPEEVDGIDDEEELTTLKKKKNKVSYQEEKEDDDCDDDDDDEEFTPDAVDGIDDEEELAIAKKNKVSYREEKEDDDYEDNDDDDEEFTPDGVDEEEEVTIPKKNRGRRLRLHEDDVDDEFTPDGIDKEEEVAILKKNRGRKLRLHEDDDDEEFTPDGIDEEEEVTIPKKNRGRRRRLHEDEDDDDEEFTPDGIDDEEEVTIPKKNGGRRLSLQETPIPKGPKRKRRTKVLRRNKQKKTVKRQVSGKQEGKDANSNSLKKQKINKRGRGRRRKASVVSDSDFVSSGSSDFEFTVSEEEREQVKEASEICKRLTTNLKSSTSSKSRKEKEQVPAQRKRAGRKGKEKVEEMKIEVGKQVCGICLSDEGKRTIRGCLNCCSHYFCFACIMEWSKVESRCPLCKQRFTTISRTARADGGHDLREAVIVVPERDQVYQPSEEELRGYLDPYENFHCTECHLGGDDALMLLCDLCDSPAHTYCVGLGHEVPDGNWYCDGCRPTALASSNAQAPNPPTDHGTSNNSSPVANIRETFDLNEVYVPDTPLTQLNVHSPSPRHFIGDSQAASPVSGYGALTLQERRRIQRQIHVLLNNRRMSNRSGGAAPMAGFNLFGSQITQNAVVSPQQNFELVRMAPQNIYQPDRLQNYTPPSLYSTDVLSPRLTSLRGQGFPNQASSSMNHLFVGPSSHNEYAGVSARVGGGLDHQQRHPCSVRSNTGIGSSALPYQYREAAVPSSTLQEQLRTPF